METRTSRTGGALLLLLTTACAAGEGRAPAVQRTDSAGVEIVTSGSSDAPVPWQLERVAVVDPEHSGAGVFNPISSFVRTDAAGRIYALDYQAARVVVFDAEGRFVRAMGRKGGGPGEATFALALAVMPDGAAGVYDAAKRRLVWFGPEGDVAPEQPLDGFFGGTLHTSAGAVLHDYQRFDEGLAESWRGVRRVAAADTVRVVERASPPTKPIQLESCGMGFSGMEPIFAPQLRWSARGDTLALAEGAGYEVRILDGTREVRRVRRDVPPRPATAELAAQDLGEGMRVRTEVGERLCRADEVVEKRGFAPEIPAIGSVVLAPGGELWVRRGGVEGEALPIDVFGADGGYIGSLPPETPLPSAFLPGDRFVTVETDELDVARLAIYRVRRP